MAWLSGIVHLTQKSYHLLLPCCAVHCRRHKEAPMLTVQLTFFSEHPIDQCFAHAWRCPVSTTPRLPPRQKKHELSQKAENKRLELGRRRRNVGEFAAFSNLSRRTSHRHSVTMHSSVQHTAVPPQARIVGQCCCFAGGLSVLHEKS